jgi:hypothetical protein
MSEAWKRLDLGGAGLQAANLRLAALLKRRSRAYALLALFPLGLHRSYLEDRRGAWAYRIAAVLAAALVPAEPLAAAAIAAAIAAFALRDILWIEDALARINKRLRVEVYLSQTQGAPSGFRGRFPEGQEPERAAQEEEPPPLSFAEHEKRLRESREERCGEAAHPAIRGIKPQPKTKDDG